MKLSIITINYNNAAGLQQTMESVFGQTFADYEYIIIDGGSTDGSKKVIEKYANKLAYWVSEKDKGIYNAMNKGIDKASGVYLLFLNSGDYFVNTSVCEKMLPEDNLSYDLIFGNRITIDEKGKENLLKIPEVITLQYMLIGTPYHGSTLINKRLFNEYGLYDESLKIVSDWSFFFKVIVTGNASMKHMDVAVSYFVLDGISSKPENQLLLKKELSEVIEKELPFVVKNLLENYKKLEERNKYLENVIFKKRLIIRELFIKVKMGFKNRFHLNKSK